MKLAELPMIVARRRNLVPMWELEDALAARSDAVHATTDSPERFEIVVEAMNRARRPPASWRAMPHLMASMAGIRRSLRTVDENPSHPGTRMAEAEVTDLEAYARAAGVDDVGYARLEGKLVFQRKAVLHENAIVLTMEMDKVRIDTSPSKESFIEVHETYHRLGTAANLGWRGLHGLLITPRFGPRVRLAAVFTSVENLPFCEENPHGWIEEYCNRCKLCARECPPQAILDQPITHASGLVTCTVTERCFPYFADNYGCSICIRVCPFQQQDYATLQNHMSEGQNRVAG
jgi:epoxyqueuosine reductase